MRGFARREDPREWLKSLPPVARFSSPRLNEAWQSWRELAELSRQGVEVGGHTHSHPMLDTLPHAAARDEITRCKALIEQHTETPVASFAYPHGYSSAWVRRMVAEGHAVGHHTYTHSDPAATSAARLAGEVRQTGEVLAGVVGRFFLVANAEAGAGGPNVTRTEGLEFPRFR